MYIIYLFSLDIMQNSQNHPTLPRHFLEQQLHHKCPRSPSPPGSMAAASVAMAASMWSHRESLGSPFGVPCYWLESPGAMMVRKPKQVRDSDIPTLVGGNHQKSFKNILVLGWWCQKKKACNKMGFQLSTSTGYIAGFLVAINVELKLKFYGSNLLCWNKI